MLYYLFKYLDAAFNFPGAGVFEYLSFRAAMAIITSLIISLFFGRRWISFLNKRQVGETIRDLGLEGQLEKQGTPTMGGLIILTSILVPVILFAKLENIYILLMIFTTVWLGGIGFADDYIKVFKRNKQGLKGKYKVIGQVILGLIVGLVMYFNTDIVVREKAPVESQIVTTIGDDQTTSKFSITEERSTKTTIPFFKNNEFEYSSLLSWLGSGYKKWAFLIFIPIVIFIIVAVSNGANLTDGMDG
ncbi:MAG: phospho-N-acetylmuramoyl-pentapeptide-transferase, partial [Bacteroidales bacterium]|nr:phospho-N-acetylmuramoyl-pentapeptide-transferase [Bacteroidales bacterium]